MIYLDNAATSFPKAPGVSEAVRRHLEEEAGNANRASHDGSIAASRLLFETRNLAASLLGVVDTSRVVFTSGATQSLNILLQGLLAPGDSVLVSSCEHNSVMRPLSFLEEERGVRVARFRCGPDLAPDLDDYRARLAERPRMVMTTAVSNVTGTVFPWPEMACLAREAGALFCLDAAQAAGTLPLADSAGIVDGFCASGHKGLLGPTGSGLLYVREGVPVRPLLFGGTGSRSSEERQPESWPDAMESGTPNLCGIAGLRAALEFIRATGVDRIEARIEALTRRAREVLGALPGVRIHGPMSSHGIVSLTVNGLSSSDLIERLDRAGIAARGGLHCAPGAHRTMGTFPGGTVRLSFGWFTTEEEIEEAARALAGEPPVRSRRRAD